MENLDKIKTRIANLLAMSKDVSSPHEATIAAQRARALMDKHDLDEFDVSQADQQVFTQQRADKSYKFTPMWRDTLSVAVAKCNDCQASKAWDEKGNRYTYIQFKGYENDVALAVQMFKYLADTVDALCKKYMHENGHGSYYVARIGDAFKKGCGAEICSRLNAMTIERDALVTNAGTSLVLVKTAMVAEHFGEASYKNKSYKTAKDEEATDAVRKGREAGRLVEINKLVG